MRRYEATVTRRIEFHRVNIGLSDDHTALFPFNPIPPLERVADLISTQEWYQSTGTGDGEAICMLPETTLHMYPAARLCRVRRLGLPQLEQLGRITELDIAEDQGLLESIHVVFFPDNIVGVEYNHHGPRINRLLPYLKAKGGLVTKGGSVKPVVRNDIINRLESYEGLRMVEVRVDPPAHRIVEALISGASGIDDELEDLGNLDPAAPKMRIALSVTKEGERGLRARAMSTLRAVLHSDTVRPFVRTLKCRGRRQGATALDDTLNLLTAYITVEKPIALSSRRGRALRTNAAFSAIMAAYEEVKSEIARSPSLGVTSRLVLDHPKC